MHKALQPTDFMFQEKEGKNDSPTLRIMLIRQIRNQVLYKKKGIQREINHISKNK